MGRILGFDYGRARIGIAASDERKIIASPIGICAKHKSDAITFKEIQKKIEPLFPVELFVIGLPLLLNGKEGEMALEAKKFAEALSSFFKIPCALLDERLSSCQMDRLMKDENLSRKQRAGKIDTLSATLVLQSYLDLHCKL